MICLADWRAFAFGRPSLVRLKFFYRLSIQLLQCYQLLHLGDHDDFSLEAGCEGLLLLLYGHVYQCLYIPYASDLGCPGGVFAVNFSKVLHNKLI